MVLEELFKKLRACVLESALKFGRTWRGRGWEVTQCHTHVMFVETKTTLPYSITVPSHSHPIPFPKTPFLSYSTCDMIDQSGSVRFQALLESAVEAYEKKAGVTLADSEDSLAMRLQGCHSVDDIATLLQGQAQAIDDLQQRDRIFKSIRTTVSILSPISSVTSIADNAGLVRREVLMACFTSLTIFTDLAPTCNGDTGYPRYPTEGMCRP